LYSETWTETVRAGVDAPERHGLAAGTNPIPV